MTLNQFQLLVLIGWCVPVKWPN